MNDQLKIIIQALIDKQKTESQINAQIKQIKTDALKIGITVDDKTVSSALKEQTKLAKEAVEAQRKSLEKIYELKQKISKTDVSNTNTLNILKQQLASENSKYTALSKQVSQYKDIISQEEKLKTIQQAMALEEKNKLINAEKLDKINKSILDSQNKAQAEQNKLQSQQDKTAQKEQEKQIQASKKEQLRLENEQTKLAQNALNAQKQSLEKILQLKTQIAQTDSTNKNALNVLNQQLNAEQSNYKLLSQEANKYNDIISKEERRKTLMQDTVALADKLRLATANKADTSIQQQKQAVIEYNKTINDTLRSLNAIKNNATFKNNYNNVNVQSSVSSVQSLITSFKNLQIQMGSAKSPEALDAIKTKLDSLRQNFSNVSNEAKSLEQILKNASSATKLTNDKAVLNNQITSWLKNNTKAAGDFGETLKNIQRQIKTADEQQLKNLRGQFRSIQTEASSMGKLGNTTFDKLFNNFKKFASWVGIGNIFMNGIRAIQNGISYLKELDNALTLINITMPVTSGEMQKLADKSNEMAKQLGVSTTQVLKAATIYANANESAESILQKSQATVMLSAVSGLDTSTTADIIQGAINQFDLAEDSAMHVSDVFQKVSENMAVDFSKGINEIAQAISVSGSVAEDAGLSLEEYASMIGTIVEKTRISGSTVGQALRTIFTRITKASSSGESSDEDISKAETSLRAVGIEVRKDKDTFRELDDILGDLAGKWENLTDVQRSNIAYEIAGTRQTSIVKSLLKEYDRYIDILGEAENAAGTSAENQAVYAESLTGKINTFTATVQGLWENANLTGSMKSAVDAGTGVVSVLSTIIDKLGLINTIVASIVAFNLSKTFIAPAVISQLTGIGNILGNFSNFKNLALGLDGFKTALASANGSIIPLASSIDSLSYSQQALVLSSQGVTANMAEQILMQNGMTKSDASLMLSKYGLVTTSKEVSTAQMEELLTSTALNENQKQAILVNLGYINSITGEITPLKAVTAEKLTNALTTEGLSEVEAKAIITSLGFGTAQKSTAVGTGLLTEALKKQVSAIWAWLTTNPVGWCVLAASAIAVVVGGVALYNKHLAKMQEEAKEATKEVEKQANALADLRQQYINIADGEGTLSEKTKALNEWKEILIETYGLEKDALKNVNLEREKSLGLIDEEIAKQNREERGKWLGENADVYETAKEKMHSDYGFSGLYDNVTAYGIKTDDINKNILNMFDSISESDLDGVWTSFGVITDDLNENYDKFQDIISKLGNKKSLVGLTESEEKLLKQLNKTSDKIKKEIDTYKENFDTGNLYTAQNLFEDFSIDENSLDKVNKDNYKSWKNNLLATAKGDKDVAEQLSKIAEEQFADLEQRVQNISKARDIFGLSNVNSAYDAELSKQKEEFIRNLSNEDLGKLIQIPDAFANGIDGATEALKNFNQTADNGGTSAVTLDKTLSSVSDNLDILSAVQRDLVEDGHLSVDTMQKLIEAGLDYNTIVGSSGETLREFILAEIDAEIATTNLALSVAEANVEMLKTMGIGGDALAPFIAQVDNLKSKVAGLENVKDITINTQYTKTSSTSSTKSEVPEQIKSFKTLEAEYQHLVNVKKMSEEDFMAWYSTAYKNAYKGYENSEEYASDYRSAMEKVFTWEEDRQKDLFDKRIQSINNEIDLVIKTKTDFSGNELETKEYFRQLKDLYTQQIDETNLRINEVLEQGVIGNGEYLEELEKQKIEYTQKIADLNKEAFESEKEYIESIKDAELKAIDDRIDKVKEEQKAKEEAYQKEIDSIQDKIDTMNDANDEQEKANDLKEAGLELEQAKLDLEKARNSYSKKVINSSGEVEYKTDNNAIAEAEKKFKDAEDKVAKLTIQARMDALEKQKEEQEQLQDKSNTDYDNQIKAIEEEKKTREQFYIDCIEKLDALIDTDKQTESNSDVWEEVAKTDTTVSTDNGVTTVDGKEIPSSQATQPEQKQTYSPTTVNDYFKSMGINIPNVSDMVNMFPDITKSLFDNMLGNTSSSIANTSSIVNNDGGVVNTITVGDIVISNPVGNINDLSKELKTQLPSAIKKLLAK